MSDCPKLLGGFMYELVDEKHPLTKTHFKDIFVTLESVRARDAWLAGRLETCIENLHYALVPELAASESPRLVKETKNEIRKTLRILKGEKP